MLPNPLPPRPGHAAGAEHEEASEAPWPIRLALATLAGVTVLVALVSEIFVESVQKAAEAFGMTPAFVGFILVALVGGAAEMASAFSGACKNRLDLSVGIALGSADRAVRRTRTGPAELRGRTVIDRPAILAGCRGNGVDRGPSPRCSSPTADGRHGSLASTC